MSDRYSGEAKAYVAVRPDLTKKVPKYMEPVSQRGQGAVWRSARRPALRKGFSTIRNQCPSEARESVIRALYGGVPYDFHRDGYL